MGVQVANRHRHIDGDGPRFSWYEPLRDPDAIRRAVAFVLCRKGLFLNTTSDANLLPGIFEAAESVAGAPATAALEADTARFAIEPLFVRGVAEEVGPALPAA